MAGFSLEVNDAGVDIPRYVEPATTSPLATAITGLADIGESLLGVEAARNRAAQAAEPTQGQVNKAAYGALAEGLYNLNGIDDPAQVRAKVGSLVAAYEISGQQLGTEEVNLIRRSTGIDINVIPPMDAAANTMMKELGANPQYISLAQRQLRQSGETVNEENVMAYAYRLYQSTQADLLAASTFTAASNADFPVFEARANNLISSLTQVALEGLSIEARGGDVATESIMGLTNNLSVLRTVLTRPTGVDASLYAPITEQLDALDALIVQIQAVDAQTLDLQSTEMLQAASRVLLAQAGEEGGANAALAAAALQTPEGRTQFFTANADLIQKALRESRQEVLSAVGKVGLEAENLNFTPFNDVLNPPDPAATALASEARAVVGDTITVSKLPPIAAPTDTPDAAPAPMPVLEAITLTTEGLHDPSWLEGINSPAAFTTGDLRRERDAGLTIKDRVNLIDVSNGLMVAATNGKGIQNPEVRNGFVGGTGQMTAAIATSKRLFDPQYLQGVFSPEFFATLGVLKNIDPEAHAMTQERVQNALMAQYAQLALTSSKALQRGNLNVDSAGGVTINPNTGVFSSGEINAVNTFANELYNGSLVALLNDRGRRIEGFPNVRSWVATLSNDYVRLRDAISAQRVMSDLLSRAGIENKYVGQIYDEATALDEVVSEPKMSESARAFLESEEALIQEESRNNSPIASMEVQGSGTKEDPITFTDEEGMTDEMIALLVPAGAYYTDATGRVLQKREGSRAAEPTDSLGTVTANGSRTNPIQPFWDTMSEQEALDSIPNNVFFVDPEGVTRFKGV
jgi:hypothetical protein